MKCIIPVCLIAAACASHPVFVPPANRAESVSELSLITVEEHQNDRGSLPVMLLYAVDDHEYSTGVRSAYVVPGSHRLLCRADFRADDWNPAIEWVKVVEFDQEAMISTEVGKEYVLSRDFVQVCGNEYRVRLFSTESGPDGTVVRSPLTMCEQ